MIAKLCKKIIKYSKRIFKLCSTHPSLILRATYVWVRQWGPTNRFPVPSPRPGAKIAVGLQNLNRFFLSYVCIYCFSAIFFFCYDLSCVVFIYFFCIFFTRASAFVRVYYVLCSERNAIGFRDAFPETGQYSLVRRTRAHNAHCSTYHRVFCLRVGETARKSQNTR